MMSEVRGDVVVAWGFTTSRPRTRPRLLRSDRPYPGRVRSDSPASRGRLLGHAPTSWGLRVSAPLVAAEGLALLIYGLYLIVQVARFGITGPEEVSNVPAVALEIVIFTGFGVGVLLAARGLWRARRPARAPAVLTQIIAVVVGGPLAFSSDPSSQIAGIAIVIVAVGSAVALLSRGVTLEMAEETA